MSAGEVKKQVPLVVIHTYPLCKVSIDDWFIFKRIKEFLVVLFQINKKLSKSKVDLTCLH